MALADDFSTDPFASRWTDLGDGTAIWDSVDLEMDLPGGSSVVLVAYSGDSLASLDMEAQVTTVASGTNRLVGPAVRIDNTGAVSAYVLNIASDGTYVLYRYDAGVRVLVDSGVSGLTFTAGHWYTLRLAAEGLGATVTCSGWVLDHGATKPAAPGWIGITASPNFTATDTTAGRLIANPYSDVGIGGRDPGTDYDTRHSYFLARTIAERSGAGPSVAWLQQGLRRRGAATRFLPVM